MNCDICVTLTLTVSIYGQKIEIFLSVSQAHMSNKWRIVIHKNGYFAMLCYYVGMFIYQLSILTSSV